MRRLSDIDKFTLHLFNHKAINETQAIKPNSNLMSMDVPNYLNILYKTTDEKKYFLTSNGIDLIKSIISNLSKIIYDDKDFDDVFEQRYDRSYEARLEKFPNAVKAYTEAVIYEKMDMIYQNKMIFSIV